ncbi:hypothetical protein DH86_00001900 [Scytalidium sp. 3C]|nr:hypothetical protein DH86_00001900 [Scytalidium sp. 3C]
MVLKGVYIFDPAFRDRQQSKEGLANSLGESSRPDSSQTEAPLSTIPEESPSTHANSTWIPRTGFWSKASKDEKHESPNPSPGK